jgi:hypothetical protein
MTDITPLLNWITEREAIRKRRANGDPPPWTNNEILREWRFCNVRREDDYQTRCIATGWREPHADDPDLGFAMAVARFVNWWPTLAELGYPVPWEPDRFVAVMEARKERRQTCFGAAYNIGNGGKKIPKPQYLAEHVLAPLWASLTRRRLRPRDDDSLHSYYGRLKTMRGFDSFMAGQVVADLKYVAPLKHGARDWMTFAAPGPGSERGLNRVLGRPSMRHGATMTHGASRFAKCANK